MPTERNQQGVGLTSMRTRRRLIARLREQGIENEEVLQVMEQVPRHLFVDEALAHKAYEDTALPIGQNQTISQPFIVALMTELILGADIEIKKILEIGTGCGYQTAVLSHFVRWVFSIERIHSLLEDSRRRLFQLGYRNISYLCGDGYQGWQSNSPYDGILVAAAPAMVPEILLEQMADGARMVIPVGDIYAQSLKVITRSGNAFKEQNIEAVRFVPMVHG